MDKIPLFTRVRLHPVKTALALFLLVLIVALSFLYFRPSPPPSIPPTVVSLAEATLKNIPLTVSVTGSIVAPQATVIKAEQAGQVRQVLFKNGARVKKGDILMVLDDRIQKGELIKQQANYAQQKATFERYQQFATEHPEWLAPADLDNYRSQYQQAAGALKEAQENFDETRIKAPFCGRLGATSLSVGSYVAVGDSIVPIVDQDNLEIVYVLPEDDFGLVKAQQNVNFTTPSYPNLTFAAKVDYIAPLVDPTSRAFTVRAKVMDPKAALSPGMLVNVTHILVKERKVLSVPAISIVPNITGDGVYIVKNGKAELRTVTIGSQMDDAVEIKSGLTEGEAVIVSGQQKVSPGSVLTVSNS